MAPSWSIQGVSPPGMMEVLGEMVFVNYNMDRYEWNGLRFEIGRADLLHEAITEWKSQRKIMAYQEYKHELAEQWRGVFASTNTECVSPKNSRTSPLDAPKTDKRKIKDLIAYYYKR